MTARSRRELLVALGLDLTGSALVLVGSALPWARLAVGDRRLSPGSDAALSFSASDVGNGEVTAAGLIALAGLGALLALRGRWRAVLGVVLAAVGAATVASCLAFRARDVVVDASDDLGVSAALSQGSPSTSYGWVVVAAGGMLLLASGVLVLLRGRRWPALGSRYSSPAETSPAPEEGGAQDDVIWDALDRGEDPTRS